MILIISSENEFSTCDIIDWLLHYKVDFLRINTDDVSSEFDISSYIDEEKEIVKIRYNSRTFELRDVTSFWYRRGGHFKFFKPISKEILKSTVLTKIINKDLNNENKLLSQFINKLFVESKNIFSIGDINTALPNKLNVLKEASKCNIKIPKTFVTNNKIELLDFLKSCKNGIITKAIGESLHLIADSHFFSVYTEKIENIDNISEYFQPSLFQENILKKFEIRTFFIHNKMYSMAIMSQDNSNTQIDYRKYDDDVPNRFIPFNLPKEIELNITKLMNNIGMNTGSIDIIYSIDGDYIFLEVNPVGQFGMVSTPCNYYLEKEIALKLINKK